MRCEIKPAGNGPRVEYEYTSGELSCSSHYLSPAIDPIIAELPAGSVVMDLGCGNGSFMSRFNGRGLSLHGIELSTSAVAHAQWAYPYLDVRLGDVMQDLSRHELAGKCEP